MALLANSAWAVSTDRTPYNNSHGDRGVIVYNTFDGANEPRVVDLTGAHRFRLPPRGNFVKLEILLNLEQGDSGSLSATGGQIIYQIRGRREDRALLNIADVVVGGRLRPNQTVRIAASGADISLEGQALEFRFEFDGVIVETRPREAELDLEATGNLKVGGAAPIGSVTYRRTRVGTLSRHVLQVFTIMTQIRFQGESRTIVEGGIFTGPRASGHSLATFPPRIPMRISGDGGYRTPVIHLMDASGDIQFQMGARYRIERLSGRLNGVDLLYP